jgi:N-hydroxyarylamine O-acetyltransferase
VDLDRYLNRIAYDGPRAASLVVLRALHRAHTQAIPFENLSPLLGWPVALDLPSLEAKLVVDRRGGWCFEQNWLFRHALDAIGFRTRGLAARVLWGTTEDYVGPRTHMVLEVTIEGDVFLADVGFGGLTLTGPLAMTPDIEQATPHEVFRLRGAHAGELILEAKLDAWRPLYRFRGDEQLLPDYEMSNWHLCHHPDSFFRRDLVAARPFRGGRFGLRNNVLTLHRTGQASETRTLSTAAEIRAVLERDFQIALPDVRELEPILERIARSDAPPD